MLDGQGLTSKTILRQKLTVDHLVVWKVAVVKENIGKILQVALKNQNTIIHKDTNGTEQSYPKIWFNGSC